MRFVFKTDYFQDIALAHRPGQRLWYGLLALALAALPLWAGAYWISQVTLILIYAVAGLGLMLLAGYTGLVSIGHAAFLGVGAYAQSYLVGKGWPFPLALLAAGGLSAAIGVIVGLPALRVKGIYLAIATLAFGFIAEEVFARWESVTGGNGGLQVKAPAIGAWQLRSSESLYYLSLVLCVVVTLCVLNLLRGSTGRAFIAMRDSEVSAQSMGIHLARYKTLAFSLSAGIVGLAGALYAHKLRFVSPEQFGISQSIDLLLLVVVGGLGSVHGAFLGAIFLITMPQLISIAKDFLPSAIAQATGLQALVFGAVLMGFVMFEPQGLYGRWVKVRTYFEMFPAYRKGLFRRQKSFQKSERLK
ncbi:leucine/isoleucine/valine transporter permease subunit [Variovorax sp. PBL-H6]|uniref:branched-chain amino acid ABC transporter permease n=1 Tax=Variovorax sp. PBL-H6 TaxID=434009 RepID=UPI001318DAD1|nr:branched-chain amino acid ABC transporter permease [Variovorax sp. PBL-H6]VTU24877.1 leucine/isoleucine/valine transporter permease subunit [Variovorax sp. PBL-H6]